MTEAGPFADLPVSIPQELLKTGGAGQITVGDIGVDVRVQIGATTDVAFLFHGAIDRERRKVPFFQPFLPRTPRLTQVSIADISLKAAPDLAGSWYLGGRTIPLTEILVALTRQVTHRLNCTRPFFVGGSAGGFAALHLSTFHPESIAVVANPQTNLMTYQTKQEQSKKFRTALWPGFEDLPTLAERITLDLSTLYRRPGTNSVVYLQSAGDRKHVFTQMAPFAQSLHVARRNHTTIVTGFWGKLGHSATVPYAELARAVRSVHDHGARTSDEFLQTPFFGRPEAASARPVATAEPATRDVDKAARMRDHLLSAQ